MSVAIPVTSRIAAPSDLYVSLIFILMLSLYISKQFFYETIKMLLFRQKLIGAVAITIFIVVAAASFLLSLGIILPSLLLFFHLTFF